MRKQNKLPEATKHFQKAQVLPESLTASCLPGLLLLSDRADSGLAKLVFGYDGLGKSR